jgi:hypothetical protein
MIRNCEFSNLFQVQGDNYLITSDHGQIRTSLVFFCKITAHAMSTSDIHSYKSRNWKFSFFSKFKEDYSVKNHQAKTKFELDLYFLINYLHMWFQPYTYVSTKVRVWNLKISIFPTFKKDNCQKSSNLDLNFLQHIHMFNLSWICTTVGKITNRNRISFFSPKLKGHKSAKNHRTLTKFEL